MDSSTVIIEPPTFKWNYDVFLSYRGEDTRTNFTSHLDMALRQKGVNVFIDDKLERGKQISETLLKSIQEALISIIIFSQNYASSSWCLDELVNIIECKKSKDQIVLPVFYKVDPSDIRKQSGSFGEALAKHQAKFKTKIQIWREALTTAANLSGWDLGTRKEADLIGDIVKKVLSTLNRTCMPLYVAKYPVGIDSKLEYIKLRSHNMFEKNNKFHYRTQHEYEFDTGIYMVGIYGIGGIGKTTLAKALYNKIASQFEGCCFLSNVREASKQFNGLAQLQESLLYEILMVDLKVVNLDRGINIIRNRLCSKKVLIVLDDVDKLEQLEALVGGCDWFGKGSRIIVTTRNKHLLFSHGFDEIHNILGLNEDKAIELFSWHAFKKNRPSSNYLDLSKRATSYCKGHPLALVVLGSFLCIRDQAEWCSILDEFENSLNKDIKDILQLSFDGLEDKIKDIFLDISCLLVGEKVEYVKDMLGACHVNLDFGVIVLMDLSLITIENDKVQMHDLIKQMGQKIVCGESLELGKRSRLWLVQDVWEVLVNNSGTDAIKAIKLDFPNPTRLGVNSQAFRKMKNLRLLIVQNARFSTKIEYLPDSLKWIKWHGFPQPTLPSCFITKNLVGLDLQYSFMKTFGKRLELTILNLAGCSNLKKLPRGYFILRSLRYLNLSHCKKLEKIPDFSAASNLEELYLFNCTNLRMIDKSVFSLHKLTILNLDVCSNLKKLPTSYYKLWSLQYLNLSYCKKLEKIPDLSAASNLQSLCLHECTNLRLIHESVGSLYKLIDMDLSGCTNLAKLPTYLRLKSLRYLGLSECCKLESFPSIAENMESLRELDMDFTAIKELPSSIGYLTQLYRLNLTGCTNLISLPNTIYLLRNLDKLLLSGCSRFEMFPHKWDPTIQPVCSPSKMMEATSWSLEYPHLLPNESLCSHFTLLDLQSCNISNAKFLEILCDVAPFLSDLRLSENKFSSLPSCLHKFMSLWNLELKNCKFLQEIPNLPQNIQNLDASGCKSLARSPDNIMDIISIKQDLAMDEISREFLLTGIEIPEWFSYKTASNLASASFRHYQDIERTLAVGVIFKVNGDSSERGVRISCNIFICNKLHCSYSRPFLPSKSEYMWLLTTSLAWGSMEVNDWNKVMVWFEVHEVHGEVNATITRCGVHVTEELPAIQTDAKWPMVNYADFYQLEKLQSLDIEHLLLKRFFEEMSCWSNCKAIMFHAANYDPETNSVCHRFNWSDDIDWRQPLDDPISFYWVQERQYRFMSYSGLDNRGGGEKVTNIITNNHSTILSSKRYYILYFKNLDDRVYRFLTAWAIAKPRWIEIYRYDHDVARNCHFVIKRVDPSLWQPWV
uniref:TIR domain-containing protein n=1 Tax=Cucumis melo TaxID=3656 RepID=A0A9I9CIT7_CUCME